MRDLWCARPRVASTVSRAMMSDPSYRLVFDATQKYGDRTALAIGFTLAVLVAFVVGAMFVVHAVRRGHHRRVLSGLCVGSIALVVPGAVRASRVTVGPLVATPELPA